MSDNLARKADGANRRAKSIAVIAGDVGEVVSRRAASISPDGNYYQSVSIPNDPLINPGTKLTLAPCWSIVELQAALAAVGDGVATKLEVTGTSLVADASSASGTGVAVDGASGLADFEVAGRSSSGEAEDGGDDGEVLHIE